MIFRGTVAVPGRRVRSLHKGLLLPGGAQPIAGKAIASGAEAERVLQKLGAQSTQHWLNRRPQGWPIGATPRKLPTCNGSGAAPGAHGVLQISIGNRARGERFCG